MVVLIGLSFQWFNIKKVNIKKIKNVIFLIKINELIT
jgi:hypothetical protein